MSVVSTRADHAGEDQRLNLSLAKKQGRPDLGLVVEGQWWVRLKLANFKPSLLSSSSSIISTKA
ncbi:MAG: hypothetical protein WBM08_10615, partial [Prochlorococcaceae cyanobacterium]